MTVWHHPKWKYVERVKTHFIKMCHVESEEEFLIETRVKISFLSSQ